VKIVSGDVSHRQRRLARPLKTSYGEIAVQESLILGLAAEDGITGWGEAIMKPTFAGNVDGRLLYDELSATAKNLVGISVPQTPEDVFRIARDSGIGASPGRFALESALSDLAARLAGKPMSEWLSDSSRNRVPVSYLVTDLFSDLSEIASVVIRGRYRAVKIKVGVYEWAKEVGRVQMLKEQLGPDVALRLDANRAWPLDTAISFFESVGAEGIEYIEEPLERFETEAIRRFKKATGVAVAADESFSLGDDREAVIASGADVIIIKPALVGGIGETLAAISFASAKGCKVVLTSMLESEIGLSVLLHLATATPDEAIAHGLDTLWLLADADRQMTKVVDGCLAVPAGIGIGHE